MLTAGQFEARWAERSGVTTAWLRDNRQAVFPCDCGEPGCDGWQMLTLRRCFGEGCDVLVDPRPPGLCPAHDRQA
jgi:hypothetical protein